MTAQRNTILVVCEANVCRSPTAELALRRILATEPWFDGVSVESAGTLAAEGHLICEVANAMSQASPLNERSRHRSRPASPALVDGAALILTMTREQRAEIIRLDPAARSRTFTLNQAVVLGQEALGRLSAVPADLGELSGVLDRMRAVAPIAPPTSRRWGRRSDQQDVADGHNSSSRAHRAAIDGAANGARQLGSIMIAAVANGRR